MHSQTVAKFLARPLVRNAAWMGVAYGGRLFIQAVYFVILTRTLGLQGFGLYSGTLGLVAVFGAFASCGMGTVIIMRVSREPDSLPLLYGNALFVTMLSGVTLIAGVLAFRSLFFSNLPVALVLTIAYTELVVGQFISISSQAFQAHERFKVTATMTIGLSLARTLTVILLAVTVRLPTPQDWVNWNAATTTFLGIVCLAVTVFVYGRPSVDMRALKSSIRDGFHFAVGTGSSTVYSELDKSLLLRLGSAEAAGIYSAAIRLINMALIPVRSLLAASLPQFFRHGASGIEASTAYGKRLILVALAYGVVASVGVAVLAPLAPVLLGAEYKTAVDALRMLVIIIPLQGISMFSADVLTGAGYQSKRSRVQVVAAGLSVTLCIALIPRLSWAGAVITAIIVQLFLIVSFALLIRDLQSVHRTETTVYKSKAD